MLKNPQFWTGMAGLVIGLGLIVTMYWLEKRPRTDFRPRVFPTTLFMLIGMLITLGATVHLLTAVFGFTIPHSGP